MTYQKKEYSKYLGTSTDWSRQVSSSNDKSMNNISEKQQEANKKNALLGGVKTAEGKAVSRYNATRHGILRESVSAYEKADYKQIFDDLCEAYEPHNFAEEIIVERFAVAYIKFIRLAKAESELMKSVVDPTIPYGLPELYQKLGYKALMTSEQVAVLADIYSRYETAVENRMYKAMQRLEELKKTKQ